MSNHDNQTAPQIYYRPLRKWIEVTPEEKQNWERFIGTTRKAKQRAGTCCIPYKKSYNALATRYNDIIAQIQTTEQRRDERLNKAKRIETYMEQIKSQSGELTVFDPRLWLEVVDIATVYHDGRIVFRFLDGREIEA